MWRRVAQARRLAEPPSHKCKPLAGGLLNRHALVGEQLLQFARLEHLADDVAAADELTLHVKLGNGRPVRIDLDAVAQFAGLENVQALVGDADVIENLDHLARESALRKLRRALHEQHDVVGLHFIVDELFDAHYRVLGDFALRQGRDVRPSARRSLPYM